MKKSVMILSLLLVSQFAITRAFHENPGRWKKINEYALAHKDEVIADGPKVIAASLGTQAVTYINKKAYAAINRADMKKNVDEALTLLTTYGLLGADEGIKELIARKSAGDLTRISTTTIGTALALFWGIGQTELAARIAAKGVGTAVKEGVEKVKEFAEKYF